MLRLPLARTLRSAEHPPRLLLLRAAAEAAAMAGAAAAEARTVLHMSQVEET
jgi:hypothetical protein